MQSTIVNVSQNYLKRFLNIGNVFLYNSISYMLVINNCSVYSCQIVDYTIGLTKDNTWEHYTYIVYYIQVMETNTGFRSINYHQKCNAFLCICEYMNA